VPIYHYECQACHKPSKHLLPAALAKTPPPCSECQGELRRTPQGASVNGVTKLDNGIMAKALERPDDVERLHRDRKNPTPIK
jgi:putative FmdB family regulatory protein